MLVAHAIQAGLAGPKPGAQAEVPFAVRLNTILVRGTIDRIDITKDGAMITDYKVGERTDDHLRQVQAYLWATHRAGSPEPIRGRVVYLRGGGAEVLDVTEGTDMDAITTDLDNAITSGRLDAAPGVVCAACAHRSVCAVAA
jgi:RecB family exonuclease